MHSVNIFGRYNPSTGIGQHSKAFLSTIARTQNVNFINTHTSESSSLDLLQSAHNVTCWANYHHFSTSQSYSKNSIGIYTDVLSQDLSDRAYLALNNQSIKVAYVVWDSNVLPRQWVEIINQTLDAVLVPYHGLVKIMQDSGVYKPIFQLPLSLNLHRFLNFNTKAPSIGKEVKFLCIASGEQRKNIHLVIESFDRVFKNQSSYKLTILISYIHDHHYMNYVSEILEDLNNPNIYIISGKNLSNDEYFELCSGSDCYISLSGGEGYGIPAREFLALGKPIIITDAYAYSDLSKRKGVIGIPCTIPKLASYNQIQYPKQFYGYQYEPYPGDVDDALEYYAKNILNLYSREIVSARKSVAREFNVDSLEKLFVSLVNPNSTKLSKENRITHDGVETSDHTLLKKYMMLRADGPLVLNNAPKKVVVRVNDGGFFSIFNRFISYLVWEKHSNSNSIVLPDWRASFITKNFPNPTSFCYGKPSDGNIWLKLFYPIEDELDVNVYNDQKALYKDAILVDDYNEMREPNLTYIHAYKLYKDPNFAQWRHWYNLYYIKYIKPRGDITEFVQEFSDTWFKEKVVISAHIRHPNHAMEQHDGKLPTNQMYLGIIEALIEQIKKSNKNYVVFIATDQHGVVEFFKSRFSGKVCFVDNVSRVDEKNIKDFNALAKDKKQLETFQIQHITASNISKWDINMAKSVIIDAMLLAKSDYFVHITSNIATAVAFMNPKVKMIYCE